MCVSECVSAGGRGEKPTCIRVITISAGPRWRQENKQRVRVRRSGRGRKSGRDRKRHKLEGRNGKARRGRGLRLQNGGGKEGEVPQGWLRVRARAGGGWPAFPNLPLTGENGRNPD